ncbi:MAG TPA: two-component sensor histidine kinase [Gammaproteobacteria bacterium]|nr:two-component sensor histidine kinase [Gammaproteobacteria bacterium]|tara:strand:+ start:1234 stop:2517 length:1284 start_codon:yes stop_codon:yes gene_type:complete
MSKRRWLRAPASLLGRTNLILAVSASLIVIVSIIALYTFVINPITQRSADDEAALMALSAQTWVELPPSARPYFELELAQNHDLIISEAAQDLPQLVDPSGYISLVHASLIQRLDSAISLLDGDELVWLEIPMGGFTLQVGVSAERTDIQPLFVAIIIFGVGAAIVFATSLLIVQRITKPLVKVAKQAERFRGTQEIEPLLEEGPRELVSLTRNFNEMARDISVLLNNRTTLMAGISHDLRTPLTRLRLGLALLPASIDATVIRRFENNLEVMDELISDALRFARGTKEVATEVDLQAYVKEIVHTFDHPIEVGFRQPPEMPVRLAANAFARVVANLINNAVKHGERVSVSVFADRLVVADDGPGIPEDFRQQVFQPFFRIDQSRNPVTGGSGLGLAIVKQLCDAHGWQISIESSPDGGCEMHLNFA